MTVDSQFERVLRLYPADCQSHAAEKLSSTGGFSGAELWRLKTDRGTLCLRRWPPGHPNQQRLEFIQAVLWHVDQEGFHRIPLPLETQHHHGYVLFAGHLWELTPWLDGVADYRQKPSPARLHNALAAVAQFHQAAATFPLPETGPIVSPGIVERRTRLEDLLAGRLEVLREAIRDDVWPQLAARGRQLVALAARTAPRLAPTLEAASKVRVPLQPCMRDIWHAHVLFADDRVSGLVDFGSMRAENVAADVARLLGSLAGDNAADWQRGLAAYQEVRPLADDELRLITAFDRSTVLMGGLQWLEWIYVEGREFAEPAAVLSRLDEFLSRLATLSQMAG